MKILVTGSNGFIGRNLVAELHNQNHEVFEFDIGTSPGLLKDYCSKCDFVYHLAGVNRPQNTSEYMEGNYGFTSTLLDTLRLAKNQCSLMLSSSIQAELDNPYGASKRAGEELLLNYSQEVRTSVYIYRFTNLFGKWSRPNYNSVIATFCHNIARDIPITVNDSSTLLNLVYIDDVINSLVGLLEGKCTMDNNGFCTVLESYTVSLGRIAELIVSFKECRNTLHIPEMPADSFEKKLYSTYLSYLPTDQFAYPLKMNSDERGSFTELLRSKSFGQISVNVTKPGIEKGNHWHHTKNEKFIVVSGKGLIQFRRLNTDEVFSYHVSGDQMQVVDIPVGYTHNIINEGDTDLVTVMWCNECFDPARPDTYYLVVNKRT